MSALVSTTWLEQHLTDPDLIILDASVDKVVGMTAIEYDQFSCIANARFFDIAGKFHLAGSPVANTMPTSEQFSEQANALGIKQQSKIVIYDNQGIYSAPRAWWMFKAMAIEQVFVLDGGLPAWLAQSNPTANHYSVAEEIGNTSATAKQSSVLSSQQVLAAIDQPGQQIVDARSFSRFSGTEKEPRPGLRAGHIPSSICIHFASLLENGRYKSNSELEQLFKQAGLHQDAQLIASCGSGMTACILLLAAYNLGYKNLSLYDGSWSEWGADHSLPTATLE